MKHLFILVSAILNCMISLSADTIYLKNDIKEHLVTNEEFEVFEDTKGEIEFEKILTKEFQSKFFKPGSDLNTKTNTYLWCKFSIINNADENKNWILQIPLHTDKADIYILEGNKILSYQTGENRSFESRQVNIRTLAFELPPGRNTPIDIYIRIYSEKYSDLSFILSLESTYLEVHTTSYLFLGFIYGILFLMIVYNLILYISIREKIYLYYILYTLSAIFFISWKDGLGFQLVWPNYPIINHYHYNLGLFLLLTSFIIFTNDFLELKKKLPKFKYFTFGIIIINFFHLCFTWFSHSGFDPLPYTYIIGYLYILGITTYFLISSYKPARYLFVSLACIITALVVIKLRYLNLLGWNWFVEYILNYAVVSDALAMSLAISDKLSYLRLQEKKVQEAFFVKEKLITENEKITESHRSLEEEYKQSSNELSLMTTHLIRKTEFLNRFHKEIQEISKEHPEITNLQKLSKNFEKELDLQNEWNQFKVSFDKQHASFIHRLQDKYPQLKTPDLLLCVYIKLNKSNKEIAEQLNITVSGVEKKRTRLKEKLNLDSGQSLSDFILNLNG